MRRILLPLALALAALVAAGVALNLVSVPGHHAGPADMYLSCPLQIVEADAPAIAASEEPLVRWEVVRTVAGGREPDIRGGSWTDATTPEGGATCVLDIRRVPGRPLDGIDWRIGHAIEAVDELRGRTARFRMLLLAERPVSFSGAYVYAYDGTKGRAAGIPGLPAAWQEYSFTMEIDENARLVEFWLRPTIHGEISTPTKLWFGGARIELLPDEAEAG